MKRTWIVWSLLWVAFFTVGMLVRHCVSPDSTFELYGYDYGTYTENFASYEFMTYMPFRHPLLGLFAAPFINFGAQAAKMSPQTYFILLHAMFALFGTLAAWLVWTIGGWVAVCVFLTIPFAWIAAAVPESYAISMCILLAVAWWAKNQGRRGKSALANGIVWATLFIAAGGVTLTNGIKVVMAYVIANRLSRRQWKWLVVAAVGMLAIGVAFFALRMWMWNSAHPDMQKSVSASIGQTIARMQVDMTLTERMKAVAGNFFLFPFTMGNSLATIWAVLAYAAAAVGAWVARRDRIVWVMGGMFAVDVAVHIVCGWALDEAWIFSPHWVWMVPVLIGLAFGRKEAAA